MTAVEFIVEKLTPFNWTKEQMQEHYKDAIEQAKEMEKEHKIEFAKNCLQENDCFFDIEQYYNQTFKSE